MTNEVELIGRIRPLVSLRALSGLASVVGFQVAVHIPDEASTYFDLFLCRRKYIVRGLYFGPVRVWRHPLEGNLITRCPCTAKAYGR